MALRHRHHLGQIHDRTCPLTCHVQNGATGKLNRLGRPSSESCMSEDYAIDPEQSMNRDGHLDDDVVSARAMTTI